MSSQPIRKKAKNEIHVHPHTKRLARYLRFTPNDLLYNRNGYLSPSQTKKVWNQFIFSMIFYVGAIVGLLAMLAVSLFIPWVQDIIATDGIFADFSQLTVFDWLLLIVGIIILVLFVFMIRQLILSRNNLKHSQVKYYIGSANRKRVEDPSGSETFEDKYTYFITIKNRTFDVDEELYKLCQKSFIYCAYVAPSMDEILAIEVVDNSIHDMPKWMQKKFNQISMNDFQPSTNEQENA